MINKFLKKNIKKVSVIALFIFTFLNLFNINTVVFAQENASCQYYVCIDPNSKDFEGDIVTEEEVQSGQATLDVCTYWECDQSGAKNYHQTSTSEPEEYNYSCEWDECTDIDAMNYGNTVSDPNAVSCRYYVCTDPNSPDYNPTLTTTDKNSWESCSYEEGCMDSAAFNYDTDATQDDGSCRYFLCTNNLAITYNDESEYTTDPVLKNTSCLFNQCSTDSLAANYGLTTSIESEREKCRYAGCTDSDADNDSTYSITDNSLCTFTDCFDNTANNFNSNKWNKSYGTKTNNTNLCTYNEGCTDSTANNYDSTAVVDDGSCRYDGCIYSGALNYDSNADDYDNSCEWYSCSGAGNENAVNFEDPTDTFVGGTSAPTDMCIFEGCTDLEADNYDPEAVVDDGSCTYTYNCHDTDAVNYDSDGVADDDLCEFEACTDNRADNYNLTANGVNAAAKAYGTVITVNSLCDYTACMDSQAENYLQTANGNNISDVSISSITSDSSICEYAGCTDADADNDGAYDITDNTQCEFTACLDNTANNYNTNIANKPYGTKTNNTNLCTYNEGCTDSTANNYDSTAVVDDGSCTYDVLGCTNSIASNYNASADTDDGSCLFDTCVASGAINEYEDTMSSNSSDYNSACEWYACYGSGNENAINFEDPADTVVATSAPIPACIFEGCTDNTANNYDSSATIDDGSCTYDVLGCMDMSALNYNSLANIDDGSCTY